MNIQGTTTPLNRPDQGTQIPRGQPMGPPPQPPAGYRSAIYGSPVQRMEIPRSNGEFAKGILQNGNSLLRRATTPASTMLLSDERTDKTSYENDILVYSGVDLKAEENNIRRENELLTARQSSFSTQYQPDRSRNQSFLNQKTLVAKVQSIALQHKILNVHPEALAYLALATQERIRELVEAMIVAKNHRIHSEHINLPPVSDGKLPMYKEVISLDVKSQLAAIEKVEREQERKRRESLVGPLQDSNLDDEKMEDVREMTETQTTQSRRPKRQKKEKETTSASQINRSTIDSISTSTNQTALVAAGGLTKSWMLPPKDISIPTTMNGGISSSSNRPSRGRTRSSSNITIKQGEGNAPSTFSFQTSDKTIGMNNEATPTVTVKDALFVLERDRGGGGQAGGSREVLMKGYVKWLR
ncbi:hypothetical protein Glove_110g76 [Diversispora epigaea]|uniref:Transcription initiation factor TFIID subunit 4 n=1 Tax=Diversispora epigaea TaxID=1348612 RepID=A0A397J8E8_9GLOM|nr:hypothetical protein Glove_110g76 [Diversispora epigaea]